MTDAVRRLEALPMQTRLMPLGDIDVDNRTVLLTWTTGATTRRKRMIGFDAIESFDETLVVSEAAIDLTRMKAGAPVVDTHQTTSIAFQLAVVDDAWIVGERGDARIRFPSAGIDPASDRAFGMVREKIIRNVSVGYRIDQVRLVEPTRPGDVLQMIVERWTPLELSLVTVPVDPGAQTRSADLASFPVAVTRPEAVGMSATAAARSRMGLRARFAGLAAR
jgi:hypothetical protein